MNLELGFAAMRAVLMNLAGGFVMGILALDYPVLTSLNGKERGIHPGTPRGFGERKISPSRVVHIGKGVFEDNPNSKRRNAFTPIYSSSSSGNVLFGV